MPRAVCIRSTIAGLVVHGVCPSFGFGPISLLDELPNRRGRHCTGLPSHFVSGLEHRECRDGVDAIPLRQARQRFGIYLGHEPSAPPLTCDLDQFRGDHFARSAPRRPELHQHRQRGLIDKGAEECFIFYFDWFAGRPEFGVSLSASEDLPEPFVNQAITLAALWAG